jgi:leucyl aminopeptidase (aminopeptidase T)
MSKTYFHVNEDLMKAAEVAINEALAVKNGEHVLIITNPLKDVYKVSQALYVASAKAGASPVLMTQPKKLSFDYAEPAVINAIKTEPEVVISISAERLGKDKEALKNLYKGLDGKPYAHIFDHLLHGLKKIRAFWSPTVTTDIFVRTVPIDYSELRNNCAKISQLMKDAKEVHVETALGTDISVGIRGRKPKADDGDFSTPGKGGNLPSGEVYISPELGASNGTLVFDGSITLDKTLVIKEPIKIQVKDGFATKIGGKNEAKKLSKYIEQAEKKPFEMVKKGELDDAKAKEYSKNARSIGELGIGLNPKAKIVGNVLEDEKVLGTVHFAIGSNYDQDALALIHSDGIIKQPTVTIDGKVLMKQGKIII